MVKIVTEDATVRSLKEDIAKRWDTHTLSENDKVVRPRWWKSKPVWRHINANYAGLKSDNKLAFHDFIHSEIQEKQALRN